MKLTLSPQSTDILLSATNAEKARAKANMVKARGMKCGSSLELAAGPLKLQCYKKRKIEKQAKKSSQNNNYNLKKVIQ